MKGGKPNNTFTFSSFVYLLSDLPSFTIVFSVVVDFIPLTKGRKHPEQVASPHTFTHWTLLVAPVGLTTCLNLREETGPPGRNSHGQRKKAFNSTQKKDCPSVN